MYFLNPCGHGMRDNYSRLDHRPDFAAVISQQPVSYAGLEPWPGLIARETLGELPEVEIPTIHRLLFQPLDLSFKNRIETVVVSDCAQNGGVGGQRKAGSGARSFSKRPIKLGGKVLSVGRTTAVAADQHLVSVSEDTGQNLCGSEKVEVEPFTRVNSDVCFIQLGIKEVFMVHIRSTFF